LKSQQPQQGCAPKPKVAAFELPWVKVPVRFATSKVVTQSNLLPFRNCAFSLEINFARCGFLGVNGLHILIAKCLSTNEKAQNIVKAMEKLAPHRAVE
jgi:hypothetical protein